jgi:hypothetical protein
MYIGLSASDTLHKKPCRIGPFYANFVELREREVHAGVKVCKASPR